MEPTLVVRGARMVLTMDASQGEGRLGCVHEGAVALAGDEVLWVGPDRQAPSAPEVVDARGALVLPGLVDCHTHAVWAGSRASEFERRLAGEDYSAILESGGGILSTVRATRAAGVSELTRLAAHRLRRMLCRGVTTVEVKSGYGLSPEAELAQLVAARAAGKEAGVRVVRTFLGAHTIPAEHRADRAGYVQQVIGEQLPRVAGEADMIDVYVDRGAFTVDEGRAVLQAGMAHGLQPRIHAEQRSASGAAKMAAELGARSADHLERIDAAGIAALAEHGTVAVLLPGAMLYLQDPAPPVGALREAGVPLAVATDLNPGTSPLHDLWAATTLATITLRLTVAEALLAVTAVAADALGRPDLGRIRPGAPGDLVVLDPPAGEPVDPAAIVQHLGGAEVREVLRAGKPLASMQRIQRCSRGSTRWSGGERQ